jgi:hypothetical protein
MPRIRFALPSAVAQRGGLALALAASLALAALLALMSAGGRTSAAPTVKVVQGHIESQVVAGPACPSPVGLCTQGKIIGDLQGELRFTALSLAPAPNQVSLSPSGPSVFFYTGQIAIQGKDFALVATDAGAFDLVSGALADLTTLDGGQSSGRWAGARGQLRIAGTCDLAGGTCSSDYQGTVQVP